MTGPGSPPPELPGFELLRWLGKGGFADVWLFRRVHPERKEAVKVLHIAEANDSEAARLAAERLERFHAEAATMSNLPDHNHIARIHDVETAVDGRPCIRMVPYLNPTFDERAKGGRLSIATVLTTGIQIAGALQTAHDAGVLHRDLKPSNLLASDQGDPVLTDFGIAGIIRGGHLGHSSFLSPGYAAPEVESYESEGTFQSDVFGLAATVYALATGRSPFQEHRTDSPEAVRERVLAGRIQPLGRADIRASFELVIRDALAPSSEDRPASAYEFATALLGVEAEIGYRPTRIPARPPGSTSTGHGGATGSGARPTGYRTGPSSPPATSSPDPDGGVAGSGWARAKAVESGTIPRSDLDEDAPVGEPPAAAPGAASPDEPIQADPEQAPVVEDGGSLWARIPVKARIAAAVGALAFVVGIGFATSGGNGADDGSVDSTEDVPPGAVGRPSEPPLAPGEVNVTSVGSGRWKATWTAPESGGPYRYRYRWTTEAEKDSGETAKHAVTVDTGGPEPCVEVVSIQVGDSAIEPEAGPTISDACEPG